MKTKHLALMSTAVVAVSISSNAIADLFGPEEHFDVWMQHDGSSLFTGSITEGEPGTPINAIHRVFGAEFGEEPTEPFAADEPGFQSLDGAFDPFFDLRIDIAGPVQRWVGGGFGDTVETITLEFGPESVTSGDGFIEGFSFGLDDQGGFHGHFEIILNGGALASDPTDGVYLLPLQLDSADGSLNASDTFWFVMNLNMEETVHDEAIDWVETNLVPAPGALAILGLVPVVGMKRRRRTA